MRAGLLRHKAVIRKPTGNNALDGLGDPAQTSEEHATVWASIEPLRGREFAEARQVHAIATHKVRFRAGGAIVNSVRPNTSMWLVHGDRELNLLEVRLLDERQITFECIASEREPSREVGASA